MKPWILALVGTFTSIAAAAACGSSSGNSGGPGGGDDGGGGSSGGGEGGSSGGEGGSGSGGGHVAYTGSITASKTSAATPVYTLAGAFVSADAGASGGADASATSNCTGTVSGSCCYMPPVAASDAGASDAGPTIMLASAGAITITDGTTAIAALNPGTNGGYGIASSNNPSVKWQPGDTLKFSAAGAAVQAFNGSVVTVQDFAGVTPALTTTPTTVPITADFVVKWTPGNGTTVRLFVDALKGTAQQGTFTCDAADSAGTVTLPKDLLSHLAAADTGVATLTRGTSTPVNGPNAAVTLQSSVLTGGTLKFQ